MIYLTFYIFRETYFIKNDVDDDDVGAHDADHFLMSFFFVLFDPHFRRPNSAQTAASHLHKSTYKKKKIIL